MVRNLAITTITMLILLLSCSIKDRKTNEKTDISEMGMKGKVKSLVELEYRAEDKFGEVIKGDLITKTEYYFNENGYLNDYKVYEPDEGLTKRETSFYNSDKKIIEYNQYYKNILESKETYKYDNEGNNIEISYFNKDGNLTGRIINIFDTKGNEVKKTSYNSEGNLERIFESNFDPNGNKIKEILYEPEGVLKRTKVSVFDERSNEIETSHFNSNDILESKYYKKYDHNGNVTEINFYSYGALAGNVLYKYDSKGNEIECTDSSIRDGIKYIYTSDYKKEDLAGNWIILIYKIMRLSNNDRVANLTITERKFEYY